MFMIESCLGCWQHLELSEPDVLPVFFQPPFLGLLVRQV
jgi:hypothetical protein